MTNEEIILHVREKYKYCKNKIVSVKEVFPKEPMENNFEKIFLKMMKDYIKENAGKKN